MTFRSTGRLVQGAVKPELEQPAQLDAVLHWETSDNRLNETHHHDHGCLSFGQSTAHEGKELGLANVGAGRFKTASPLVSGVPTLPNAGRGDVFASRMGQVSVMRGLHGLDRALAALNSVEQKYGATDPFRILIADRRNSWDHAVQERVHAQAERTAWRIVREWVHAQVTLIQTQMVTVTEVFMPYMLLDGHETAYERLMGGGMRALTEPREEAPR